MFSTGSHVLLVELDTSHIPMLNELFFKLEERK